MAAEYGTPVYRYDLAEIRRAHAELTACLPTPSVLHYSLKANPHPDVAAVLAQLGCRAEVASTGECETALRAGFAPGDIMLAGPAKTAADLAYALDVGIRWFSVDSPDDLARVGAGNRPVECLLRVNADRPVAGMGLSMAGTASQFGADASWVLAEPGRFRGVGNARVVGVHCYMGTNITDPEVLLAQFAVGASLAGTVGAALDVEFTSVDLGGGFGAPYARTGDRPRYPGLARRLGALLDGTLPGWRGAGPLVSFESGRFLVGSCGTLVCRVVDVKRSKGRTYVILDAGVHQLGGMSGLRRLPRIVPELLTGDPRPVTEVDCVVTGPLCTPLDTWADGVPLPLLRAGDLVAVPNTGAYGLTASLLGFLGHRPATEVVVDGTEVVSATRLVLERTKEIHR
jgi:diaminopimelate decarboxylase